MKHIVELAVVVVLGAAMIALLPAQVQKEPAAPSAQELTSKRLHDRGWWPTKGDAARKDYVGSEVCSGCHIAEGRGTTSMSRASSRSLDSRISLPGGRLIKDQPPFETTITRDRRGSSYAVGRGGEGMAGQITWTMGDGEMGRTFIVQGNEGLYEGQYSYFTSIAALDLTPGHVLPAPGGIDLAFGTRQEPATAKQCFACHTTASSIHDQFDPGKALPGVGCEVCHGPGAKHATAVAQNQIKTAKSSILNPVEFDPAKLVDYCGACHRAPLDVVAAKDFVPINVRFQPYRLTKSRCWSKPDARLTCIACHNPHEQVVRDSLAYDVKCLACHSGREEAAEKARPAASVTDAIPATASKPATCPVSRNRCVTCHMPKYKVPQMHGSFTDHDIRIVREGEPYPL